MRERRHLPRVRRTAKSLRLQRQFVLGLLVAVVFASTIFFLLPSIVVWQQRDPNAASPFPVGVDPVHKTIKENPAATLLFADPPPLSAAAEGAGDMFRALSAFIASTRLYQAAASAAGLPQVAIIDPGFRKEQVAAAFGKALGWSAATQKMFLNLPPVSGEDLDEGTIAPGDYALPQGTSVGTVQKEVSERFQDSILDRYTPAVQNVVPLDVGITIASILERETSDPDEMRVISGIIWNRIFDDMKLQMDSTLQYAKATGKGGWWPPVLPKDKYIDSPYNTYQNVGLPPGPIAEPSVAAVLAALNPKQTTCLYYFHDKKGNFHCSDTYEEHVALLKKYYGRGK